MTSDRWAEVERLYHAALALRATERGAFLQEACADDEPLRHEVETLLLQSGGGDFLTPAIAVAAGLMGSQDTQLPAGRRLGPYEILAHIGAGGMGEVYRARDTKLQRDVALKILPRAFTTDPDRLARFDREARMLAALNHPNIATIYGFETTDDVSALVLELVEGQELAERIRKGPIPVDQVMGIARQIAEGLEAAHACGVIHRDLKPANIKITPDGVVKLLDFGLAKGVGARAGQHVTHAPTQAADGTREGTILGTAAYMSPEQARGQSTDTRTDIWAFGCVLYEMLTSRLAFAGETMTDTLAAILEREPDWSALPNAAPEPIRLLVHRCLQKDPKQRLRDIGDARLELTHAIGATSGEHRTRSAPTSTRAARTQKSFWLPAAGVVAAIAVGQVIWSLRPSSPATSASVSRIAISLPPGQLVATVTGGTSVAISPDGTRLAYVANQPGSDQQIYLRPLQGLDATPVPGTEGGTAPFFSADGQWLGFYADGKMKKVSTTGGTVVTLVDAGDPRGASWGSTGTIVFVPTRASLLQQVSDAGGSVQAVTRFGDNENSHRWPQFLPGANRVLFAALQSGSNWENATIAVQSLETGERRDLVEGGSNPRYAPSGHLVYMRGQTLMAVLFDTERLTVTGAAVPVVEGIFQTSPLNGNGQYSFSNTGSLVYLPASGQGFQQRLVWVSRNGTEQFLNAPTRPYRNPRLSPDGRRIAVAIDEQQMHVWLYDVTREALSRFTFEGSTNYNPSWTPDGQRIAFQSVGPQDDGLFWQLADGSGGLERFCCENPGTVGPSSWSPDGQLMAGGGFGGTGDLYVVRRGGRDQEFLASTPFGEGAAMFSPDGRGLAYASTESGRLEIYVQAYPAPGGKWQISTEGGTEPVWNRNGRELFYRNGNRMMTVDITPLPNFSAGRPTLLFEGQYEPTRVSSANYDVSPDGQRFLMLKASEAQEGAPTQINVVLNWFEELRQRVPTN